MLVLTHPRTPSQEGAFEIFDFNGMGAILKQKMSKLEDLIYQANNSSPDYSSKLKQLIDLDNQIFRKKEVLYFQKCREAESDFLDFFTPQRNFDIARDGNAEIASSGNLRILLLNSNIYSEPLLLKTEGLGEDNESHNIFIKPNVGGVFSYEKRDLKKFLFQLDPNKRGKTDEIDETLKELSNELNQFDPNFFYFVGSNRDQNSISGKGFKSVYEILAKLFE